MLTVIFDFIKVGVLILWVFFCNDLIFFYQIDTTFNLKVKIGHATVFEMRCDFSRIIDEMNDCYTYNLSLLNIHTYSGCCIRFRDNG